LDEIFIKSEEFDPIAEILNKHLNDEDFNEIIEKKCGHFGCISASIEVSGLQN
jgi:hypothetical protein